MLVLAIARLLSYSISWSLPSKVSMEFSFIKGFPNIYLCRNFKFGDVLVTIDIRKWPEMSILIIPVSTF